MAGASTYVGDKVSMISALWGCSGGRQTLSVFNGGNSILPHLLLINHKTVDISTYIVRP